MKLHRTGVFLFIIIPVILSILGLANIVEIAPVISIAIIAASLMGIVLYARDVQAVRKAKDSLAEREKNAKQMRSARERERAFYEMSTMLSSTLDSQRILDAVQSVGELVTNENGAATRLISAALLFQGGRNMLTVASSRGFTATDEKVTVPGKKGILGLAFKQTNPVFGSLPRRDPELQYFVAFQDCKSIMAIPLRAGYDYYGVLIFGSTENRAFSEDYVELLKSIGTQATIALQNAVLYQNILAEKERIVEVEEDARKKLARDLHDGPTQSIAAIAMRINFIRRVVGESHQQAFDELGKVEDLARRTTKEIRHMLFTLRPLILETQGLVAALGQLSEKMRDTHDLNVIIEGQPGVERWLDSNAQGVIFYIIEEAVNNARKHAQSQHIWVRLNQRESYFIIEIEDDGVGFNQEEVTGNYESRGSLGMVNMRERTEMVEGTLHIESQEGVGTRIQILVPIKDTQRQNPPSMPPTPPARRSDFVPPQPRMQSPAGKTQPKKPKTPIPHATKRSPGT
ncbi:MAG TPA: ATP-binding protein [Aggregatilineales bacterium]|nr:ATP-binding protein [Aggregatilineales bacterium]